MYVEVLDCRLDLIRWAEIASTIVSKIQRLKERPQGLDNELTPESRDRSLQDCKKHGGINHLRMKKVG